MPNPFCTKTLKRSKIDNVKCWLKVYMRKDFACVINESNPNEFCYQEIGERKILYYIVGASDGSNRKICDKQQAEKAYEQLIKFEKRQTKIE